MLKTRITQWGTGEPLWEGEMPPIVVGQIFGIEGQGWVVREAIITLENPGVVLGQFLAVTFP